MINPPQVIETATDFFTRDLFSASRVEQFILGSLF
jgi:hypothetical protein